MKKGCTVRTNLLLPVTWLLVLLLQFSLVYIQAVPDLRGDLNVDGFSRNYNQMVKLYEEDNGQKLDAYGRWVYPLQNSSGFTVLTSRENRPRFSTRWRTADSPGSGWN